MVSSAVSRTREYARAFTEEYANIFVKGVNGKTVTLAGLTTESTMKDLAQKYTDREGIPASDARFIQGGK